MRRAPSLAACVVASAAYAQTVSTPPEAFFQIVAENDREAARAFYKK